MTDATPGWDMPSNFYDPDVEEPDAIYLELEKLVREVNGLLDIAREAIRGAVGNTNLAILEKRLRDATTALAKAQGQS